MPPPELVGQRQDAPAAAQEPDAFAALRAGRYDEAVRALRGPALDGKRRRAFRVGDGAARHRGLRWRRQRGRAGGGTGGWSAPGRCWDPR